MGFPLTLQGQIKVMQVDLADLASVKRFTKAYLAEERGPDLLILNAGVMACPQGYTKDGFEMQIGKHSASQTQRSTTCAVSRTLQDCTWLLGRCSCAALVAAQLCE